MTDTISGWYQVRVTLVSRGSQARAYWRKGHRRRAVAYVIHAASELTDQFAHELGRLAYRIEFKEWPNRG